MKKLFKTRYMVFALLLACALAFGMFHASDDIEAYDPSSVKVTVYKSEFFANKLAAPVVVSNTPLGVEVDLVNNPGEAFGSGSVPAGSYKRIKLSVKNQILFSDSNNCPSSGDLVDAPMIIDSGASNTATVDLYFATPDDGGQSSWTANGSADSPFMMQNAIEVVAGATTEVDLRFQTAGKIYCDAGDVARLLPPDIAVLYTVSAPPVAGVCTDADIAGNYWFYHYAMRGDMYNSATHARLVNATLGDIIRNSNVVSGWGTMMLNAPTAGTGTWGVYVSNLYNTTSVPGNLNSPGMAEHRHRLSAWSNSGSMDEGYHNPVANAPANTIMGGTYTKSGQRMVFYMPEGGSFQGAVNPTCDLFAGVSLTGGDNDFIYAVRKGDFTSYGGSVVGAFPDKTMVLVQPQMELKFQQPITAGIMNTEYMYFGTDFAVLSTADDSIVSWRSSNQLQPELVVGAGWDYSSWQARQPEERAEVQSGIFNMITLGDDGQLLMPANDSLVAFGSSGTGIIAGSTEEFDPRWGSHRHSAGIIFPVNDTPTMNDLVGTWSLSLLESEVWNTVAWDTPGDARMNFYIQYGDITINPGGLGNGVANFYGINALTGEVLNSPGGEFKIYGPIDECYTDPGFSNTGVSIYNASCSASDISVPVFLINGVDESGNEESPGPSVKIALDDAKGAIAVWSPADLSGTIYNTPTSDNTICPWGSGNEFLTGTAGPDCILGSCDQSVTDQNDPDWCNPGDPSSRNTFGVGIKILE